MTLNDERTTTYQRLFTGSIMQAETWCFQHPYKTKEKKLFWKKTLKLSIFVKKSSVFRASFI